MEKSTNDQSARKKAAGTLTRLVRNSVSGIVERVPPSAPPALPPSPPSPSLPPPPIEAAVAVGRND